MQSLDPDTRDNVRQWLEGSYDAETKTQIQQQLKENPKALSDAFFTRLSFGTGGLRGIMGIGSNRMNNYTVGAATQGLANYLLANASDRKPSVLIGYDSRHHSREFAEVAAKVLAGNGIRAYIFKELRPTPLISFGCRYKECSAAIMITASHNPPQYNGFKVYWSDGGQVLPPHDISIIAEVNKITDPSMVKKVDTLSHPFVQWIGDEIDQAYLKIIEQLQHFPEENKAFGHILRVVYSNLHGTGITLVPQALSLWGITDLISVASQEEPDGSFPTVVQPNPEEKEALQLGIETLEKYEADVLIATDPDADRVGVAVRHHHKTVILNGNQIAVLCLQHICEALSQQKRLPERAAFIKTIGTTELFLAIAHAYGKPCFNVLTGFKYIGEMITHWEKEKNGFQYVFGGEESYGYLLGTHCRDKDAVSSTALICEAALHAKRQGKTLVDRLEELYQKHGVHFEKLLSLNFEDSKEGKEQMARCMEKMRKSTPQAIADIPIVAVEDYLLSTKRECSTGKVEPITLPKSNVLLFWLEDRTKVMIRPSGTEPKVKLYCGVVNKNVKSLSEAQKECEERAGKILNALDQEFS